MNKIKYKKRDDKIGEIGYNKHGTPMKIIDCRRYGKVDVEFQDDYKYVFKDATYNNFKIGQIRNPYDKSVYGVGMLGDGKYQTKYVDSNKRSKDYVCWLNMLGRCYTYKEKYPAYYDIATICDEWLNFQVFAEWYENNCYEIPENERLEVDKDILFPSNKQYAPEWCVMVPQRINLLFTNMTKNDGLPNGIRKTLNGKRYQAAYNGKQLGTHDTLDKAYSVYSAAKEEAIKQKADEYKDYIPEKLYNALYRYQVRIENDKNYAV